MEDIRIDIRDWQLIVRTTLCSMDRNHDFVVSNTPGTRVRVLSISDAEPVMITGYIEAIMMNQDSVVICHAIREDGRTIDLRIDWSPEAETFKQVIRLSGHPESLTSYYRDGRFQSV